MLSISSLPAPPRYSWSGVEVSSFHLAEPAGQPADEALLRRIAAGDQSAFQAFYDRHAGRTHVVLSRLAGDLGAAEDLLQEVFLSVWRKAGSYRPERGEPLGWLYSIARNRVTDHRRRRSARPDGDAAEVPDSYAGSSGGDAELGAVVDQALDLLHPDQRAALRMTYFAGFTYEETAERLRVPLGTLKSRLRAGLRELRAVFGEG